MQSHSNICCKLVLKYSQNCEKGFTIFLCNSWSLLDFCHFFLILLSWLRNFVQSQQQKNKIKFGSLLRGGVVGGSVGASSFGWFLGGFGWFLLVEGDFGWFQVVHCLRSYIINFTAFDFFLHSKTARKKSLLPCRLPFWK